MICFQRLIFHHISFSSFTVVSDNVCPGVVRAAFRYANAKQQVEYPGT
jgi:hypothetical protein